MVTFEEAGAMLDEIAEGFPGEIYSELNGGIILLHEEKLNPAAKYKDLYILGEYHKDRNLGRYIIIYYGSFLHAFGHLDKKAIREQLARVLKHEFTHHLESLAGERDLEMEDKQFLAGYLNSRDRQRS